MTVEQASAVGAVSRGVAPAAGSAPRPAHTVCALAWAESRALVRHPVLLFGFAIMTFSLAIVPAGAGAAFSFLTGGGAAGLWLPPTAFFASGLCATRERRSGTAELAQAAPATAAMRTAARCAAAFAPAAVTLVIVLLGAVRYGVAGVLRPEPTPAELVLLPLSVLGGGVLAVMVARWLPWRGAAIVVFVALVAISIRLTDGESVWWISYVELVEWENHELTDRRMAGSAPWHAAYLLGLCAMAAIGAMLRDVARRGPLLLVGAVVTIASAGAGMAQLP